MFQLAESARRGLAPLDTLLCPVYRIAAAVAASATRTELMKDNENMPTGTDQEELIRQLQHDVRQLQHTNRTRGGRRTALAVFGLVLLGGGLTATAQTIGDSLFDFQANQPAKASEVNFNFDLIQAWIEAKVGAVDQPTTINTTGAIAAGSLSSTGDVVTNAPGGTGTVGDRHGFLVTGNGDPAFFGSVRRGTGSDDWDALVQWGDNTDDRLVLRAAPYNTAARDVMTLQHSGRVDVATSLYINNVDVNDLIRNYVRNNCWMQFAHADNGATSPQRVGPVNRANDNSWSSRQLSGDVGGDDRIFYNLYCD